MLARLPGARQAVPAVLGELAARPREELGGGERVRPGRGRRDLGHHAGARPPWGCHGSSTDAVSAGRNALELPGPGPGGGGGGAPS